MRAYFFGNMYLSSIQQGIQAAHTLGELFLRFPERECDGGQCLWEWANQHKTMVLLNAGYSEEIRDLTNFFNDCRNPYPWAKFCESSEALDGALTNVGIILPEEIYTIAKDIRQDPVKLEVIEARHGVAHYYSEEEGRTKEFEMNRWQFKLVQRLNQYTLAR